MKTWSARILVAPALLVPAALASAAVHAHGGDGSVAPAARCPPPTRPRPPAKERPITRPRWLSSTVVTEYYPIPEGWFLGRPVRAPGIAGLHRVDWLYGASGLAMEGQGIGLDRRIYRFAGPYSLGWVNVSGAATRPCIAGRWSRGRPAWLAFGWRNARGDVTFPLAGGGWSHGSPARFLAAPRDLRFASGPSRPLAYWRSVAVDRRLIPFGSRIFVPAYCARPGRGWFTARDTGGAILGRHIDVYRPAPSASDPARKLTNQRVFVVPPGRHASETRRVPRCPRR